MREYLIALLSFGCATSPAVAPVVTKASAPAIAPLDETATYIDAPVSGKSIVLLGESLHGTNDFPRARLPVLRRLHESLGYDVLAVEGSALDAWLAQDDLYRGMSIEDASREAWLMVWNTDAMRAVLRYARDSKMYLASMDIQPAMGGGPIKKGVLRAFVARMNEYAGKNEDADALAEALLPLKTCKGNVADAWPRISALVHDAARVVRAKSEMHADALALVPSVLEERMKQCTEASDGPPDAYWKRYKEARDRYQGANVLAIRDRVSKKHRVAVWAHHSHVGYDGGGSSSKVSLAGELRAKVPNDVYAIGVFGGSGRFLEIHDGPRSGAELADVKTSDGLAALAALSPSPSGFFVDLKSANAPFANEPHAYPLEGQYPTYVLARNFDGVIYLPQIRETTID